MNNKNFLILLLALTTLGGIGLAWHEYQELVELRAAAMNKDERADWQKQIWALTKANRELQDKLAAARGRNGEEPGSDVADDAQGRRGNPEGRGGRGFFRGGRGGPDQMAAAIGTLMQKPEVQALINAQEKAMIDSRYAALFRNLNLPADQLEKLKTLLAERQTTMADVFTAAREQGLDPRSDPAAFRQLVSDSQNQINDQIKSTLGDSGFAQLTQYEQTMPQRNLVNELQQRLSYTDNPLSASQADALVNILATNTPKPTTTASGNSGPNDGPPPGGPGGRGGQAMFFGGGPGGGPGGGMIGSMMEGAGRVNSAPITQNAVAQSASVLSPPQLQALQQLQQQQQTQQQLQQMVHETMTANQPPGGSGAPPTGSAPRKGGGR